MPTRQSKHIQKVPSSVSGFVLCRWQAPTREGECRVSSQRRRSLDIGHWLFWKSVSMPVTVCPPNKLKHHITQDERDASCNDGLTKTNPHTNSNSIFTFGPRVQCPKSQYPTYTCNGNNARGPATVAVPPLHAGHARRPCRPRRQCRAVHRSAAERHACVHIYAHTRHACASHEIDTVMHF